MEIMELKGLKLSLTLSLLFISLCAYGQATNDSNIDSTQEFSNTIDSTAYKIEYEKQLELQERISNSTNMLSKLDEECKRIDKQIKKLNSKIQGQTSVINRYETWLRGFDIGALKDSINKLDNKSLSIRQELQTLEDRINDENRNIDALKRKQEIIDTIIKWNARVITTKYQDELKQPLSIIQYTTLNSIEEECNEYIENEEVRLLIERVKDIREYKATYDKGLTILNTKFDSEIVVNTTNSLKYQYTKLCIEQQPEFEMLIAKLEMYKDGVQVICEYINYINSKRTGINYSTYDFSDDRDDYYKKNKDEINKYINAIPYLKRVFEEFNKALSVNGNAHPTIEKEILSYAGATE
jgi:hypothetical protein